MADLNQTQEQGLRALRALDGEADAKAIREWINDTEGREVSNSNLGRQLQAAKMDPFVEVVGSREVGAPNPANVYGLTPEGEAKAEEVFDDSLAGGGAVDDDALRSVRRDVADLDTGMTQLRREIDAAASAEDVEAIESAQADLRARLSDVEGTVEYHGEVLERIDERLQEIGALLDE